MDENAKCPKCGGDHVSARYIRYESRQRWYDFLSATPPWLVGKIGDKEAFIRSCVRCLYEWREEISP